MSLSKPDHKRRVGPWLRRYSTTPTSRSDRIGPVVLAGGAWVVFVVLVVLITTEHVVWRKRHARIHRPATGLTVAQRANAIA